MQQTEATIYLSDQRGCTQTDTFRSFHTFNFGAFFNENKQPFSPLQVFNEDTLAAESTIEQTIEAQTTVVLLPIFGTIEVKNDFNTEGGYVTAGEAYFYRTVDEETLTIGNPYESDAVSYLQIRLQNKENQPFNSEQITTFDFSETKNQLIPFFPKDNHKDDVLGFIGQYKGREGSSYKLDNVKKTLFFYIIEGVFEVENRLLHAGDGLQLVTDTKVEWEALSNDAVVLVIEMA